MLLFHHLVLDILERLGILSHHRETDVTTLPDTNQHLQTTIMSLTELKLEAGVHLQKFMQEVVETKYKGIELIIPASVPEEQGPHTGYSHRTARLLRASSPLGGRSPEGCSHPH